MARSPLIAALLGVPHVLPERLQAEFPELRHVRWRLGGLPPRVGGWCLGRRTVSAITFRRTVFLAPEARVSAELLLHELAHVRQFEESPAFPLRYLWESIRRGYYMNRFEVDARAFAADRVQQVLSTVAQAVPRA
ncbi:MAG: DUF4157 domain-containing protein [Gemmatimonadaceae bacterium]|nr:DUF4157 domain-containing protein [Gemmatimonadaceae bacterium]